MGEVIPLHRQLGYIEIPDVAPAPSVNFAFWVGVFIGLVAGMAIVVFGQWLLVDALHFLP